MREAFFIQRGQSLECDDSSALSVAATGRRTSTTAAISQH